MRQINLICALTMASNPMAASTQIGGYARGRPTTEITLRDE
jgi:hypothetical protein